MAITNRKRTMYAVARGNELLYVEPTLQEAQRKLNYVKAVAARIGVTSDALIATVTETTTYSKPTPYNPGTPTTPEPPADPTPEGDPEG